LKKWIWILIVVVALIAILVIPIPTGVCEDGGTRTYTALTYKIVKWNRLIADSTFKTQASVYSKTRVYCYPDNFASLDSLWAREEENVELSVTVRILDMYGATVKANPCDPPLDMTLTFSRLGLPQIGAQVGSQVRLTYKGGVRETAPQQINVIRWEMVKQTEQSEQWVDKAVAKACSNQIFGAIRITNIEYDCFYAVPIIPTPYVIKMNGELPQEYCVGDQVFCTYENTWYDEEKQRVEADVLTVTASDWKPEPNVDYKPVIYLYPEEETEVSVQLNLNGKLICTYPSYGNGWIVTAAPDGTLSDVKGMTYNYLYWEGKLDTQYDLSQGFCVKGTDTAAFLETALAKLGLTRREANEFIVFWLPFMERNPYNIISFQTDAYTDAAQLQVSPQPDTVIRVFMAWRASENYTELPQQELTAPPRKGFTVVEWGGATIQ